MLVADRPEAFSPRIAAKASVKSPVEIPLRASVRHPNVASVFHLGRSGENYFYAMEFVEGQTLESLTRRSGRLEIGLALEIVSQVVAGLAAIHEQNLVHRDIKPSNIMVRRKDDGSIMAKLIDLGLAKSLSEPAAQTAISTPGGFAGTPEFASPEQFAGVPVDIRSDLYSLGATLWEMVTGHVVSGVWGVFDLADRCKLSLRPWKRRIRNQGVNLADALTKSLSVTPLACWNPGFGRHVGALPEGDCPGSTTSPDRA